MNVLLIDLDEDRRDGLVRVLEELDCAVTVHEPEAPRASLMRQSDLVLIALAEASETLLDRLARCDPLVPLVVFAAKRPDTERLLALGRARAYDCIELASPSAIRELLPRLAAAARRKAIRRRPAPVADEILGESDKMAQVRRYIDRAARSDANVVVLGESGTGKELVARAVHVHGSRADGPFVAVNCSAIPATLLESELFGHEKGAFTGAVARTRGKFEQASGGTLFFDEIGDMPMELQAKLLRVLQPPPGEPETTREFTLVGGDGPRRVDVRLVFATHRDLTADVREGRFREDLFQRINVLVIRVPPLREREDDIPLLAEHFLCRGSSIEGQPPLAFDSAVLDVFRNYDFPLNVRELEGVVRSLVILKEAGSTIVLGDLPPHLFGGRPPAAPADPPARLATLEQVEREHVQRVLEHCKGNKSRTARVLGISRPALDRKLERYAEPAPE